MSGVQVGATRAAVRTRGSQGALGAYMKQLQAIPSLGREEEMEIVQRWQRGDERAADELVRRSLRHVVYVARRYVTNNEPLEDLIAEGNLAMLHALRKFDPSFGKRFGNYARLWIRAYLTRYVRRARSLVSSPIHDQAELFTKVLREKRRLTATSADAVDEDIAARLGTTVDEIRRVEERFSQRDARFDAPVSDDRRPLHDILPADGASPLELASVHQLEAIVKTAIEDADMSQAERTIVERRLLARPGDEPTLAQLGRELSISREWARCLEQRGLARLETAFEELRARRHH